MSSDYQEIKNKHVGLGYAIKGLKYALHHEINMRVHLMMMILVIGCGIFLNVNAIEWVLLILTIGLVVMAELFNTAIELILDYLAPEWHSAVGTIKDVAAGAVLVASLLAMVVGIIIFMPKIITLLF
ncbi:undecaprenol kinase/diacylglycerol kinase (ATP) [Pelagirhabdus alkalitolerans]|uniref:Undecaprenol kinase/diacylglycerol kinase (ATP) n=1 Tax=Pelagirhabdus alkalitolerans TaxID=1612202 RepID=A0A1G6HW93_9BACI|nr:diacylglycerol kinase family protein [Pelagirhabdus alkalitolerans]SDB98408.1 undecaprenol kinase/diacylglycerol kinase (ATP) [Pelagirhabdus alkalitolerans]